MYVCVSETLSPRSSQDEVHDSERVQQSAGLHDDDNDVSNDGSVDESLHETDIARDENAHHRHHGDHIPAAESQSRCRDVAIQVNDLTRHSSSTQASCNHYQ